MTSIQNNAKINPKQLSEEQKVMFTQFIRQWLTPESKEKIVEKFNVKSLKVLNEYISFRAINQSIQQALLDASYADKAAHGAALELVSKEMQQS